MFLSAQQPRSVEIAPTTLPAQFSPGYHNALLRPQCSFHNTWHKSGAGRVDHKPLDPSPRLRHTTHPYLAPPYHTRHHAPHTHTTPYHTKCAWP